MHTFNTSHSLLNPQFQALSDNINHSPESFLYIENTSIEWAKIREIVAIRSTNRQTRSQFSSVYAYCGSCTWSCDLFYISKMLLYIFHDKVPPETIVLGRFAKWQCTLTLRTMVLYTILTVKQWYRTRTNPTVFLIVCDGACKSQLATNGLRISYFTLS